MGFVSKVPSIPYLRPWFNVGLQMDILTGTYHQGKHGQYILNGGKPQIMSVAGPQNAGKTTLQLAIELAIVNNIDSTELSIYDSEGGLNYSRIRALSIHYPKIRDIKFGDENLSEEQNRIGITSKSEMMGDEYFFQLSQYCYEKRKGKATLTTPFLDSKWEYIKIKKPLQHLVDSLTEFRTSVAETNIVEKNALGDSKQNMLWMRLGMAKKQLLTQLPGLCGQTGLMYASTAHVGEMFDSINEPMPIKKHALTYSKKGYEYKGVTEAYEFLNNIVWEIIDAKPLNNKEYNTGVKYPAYDSDREPGCTDLQIIKVVIARNKSGQTGPTINLIYSQREGILDHLSCFEYLLGEKVSDRFGITEGTQSYNVTFLPEIRLSRTTVRTIIQNTPKLKRALRFLSEMKQMYAQWLPANYFNLRFTPDELYNAIIAKGYSWDLILNTRDYWVPVEQENSELPELSTIDLMRMAAGTYIPYWLNPEYIKKSSGYLRSVLEAIPKDQLDLWKKP